MAIITEIKAIGNTVYGMKFIVCENEETIVQRTIGYPEHGAEVGNTTTAAGGVIFNAGYDYDTESSFKAYHGGPRTRLVEPIFYAADLPADPADVSEEPQWKHIWQRGAGATEIPAEILAIADRIADQAEAAMAAEVTEREPIED